MGAYIFAWASGAKVDRQNKPARGLHRRAQIRDDIPMTVDVACHVAATLGDTKSVVYLCIVLSSPTAT